MVWDESTEQGPRLTEDRHARKGEKTTDPSNWDPHLIKEREKECLMDFVLIPLSVLVRVFFFLSFLLLNSLDEHTRTTTNDMNDCRDSSLGTRQSKPVNHFDISYSILEKENNIATTLACEDTVTAWETSAWSITTCICFSGRPIITVTMQVFALSYTQCFTTNESICWPMHTGVYFKYLSSLPCRSILPPCLHYITCRTRGPSYWHAKPLCIYTSLKLVPIRCIQSWCTPYTLCKHDDM